jgi:hypothetical protein
MAPHYWTGSKILKEKFLVLPPYLDQFE